MKKFLLGFAIIISCLVFSQEVKMKKGIVYEDGKEVLKYTSQSNQTTYSTLEGNKILYIDFVPNNSRADASYFKVGFYDSDETATMKNNISPKRILVYLINESVLEKGKLNVQNISNFIKRYDEKFEESIIRHSY